MRTWLKNLLLSTAVGAVSIFQMVTNSNAITGSIPYVRLLSIYPLFATYLPLGGVFALRTNETPAKEERPKELQFIAECESGDQHFNKDGSVLRGRVNPDDIGRYQINLTHHQAAAEKLGLNLFNEEDNETYARKLFKEQGTQPWNWSRPCWWPRLVDWKNGNIKGN